MDSREGEDKDEDEGEGGADPSRPDAVEVLVRVTCPGLPGLHGRTIRATIDGDTATDVLTGATYSRGHGSDREGSWAYPGDRGR
jgi:hypothetical protein